MKTLAFMTVCLMGLLFAQHVSAEAAGQEAWRKDRFLVAVGLYRPNLDTRIRVDGPNRSGTLLNLEDDLDLTDRKTQLTLDAHFRFAKRHAIEFEYVKLARNGITNIAFEIDYEEDTIAVNSDVESRFSTEVGRLAYRFSFINSERMELSAALGLHITDLEVGLKVVGTVEELNSVTAPLPTLGGAWKYHFNDYLTFHLRGEWLDIKVDDINGALTAGRVELTWYPVRNFGFGLGYHVWDLDVSASAGDLTGIIDYRYDGPKLKLVARF